jgi:uncharacterized protein
MRDMFDEFMEELRRRQKAQEATAKGEAAGGDDSGDASPVEETREDKTVPTDGPGPDETDRDEDQAREPRPIFERGGFGGGRRARSGGPSGELPEIHLSRGWVVFGAIAVIFIIISTLFAGTVGFITDSIWFDSAGFASVFWTRFGTQSLCFLGGAIFAALFLALNLWLAGRFIPKGQLRRFSLDELLDRFSVERYVGGGAGGPFGTPRPRAVGRDVEAVTVPDIGRPVFWALVVIGVLVALGMGGLLGSAWTTIQLFIHRVPFGQTDPTFGKDISFYLFELPFFRLAQSYVNSLLLVTFALVGIRYLVAVISGASMPTAARLQLGLLVTLFLWSVAIGYQLDRYELVYSNTSGIFQGASYTDVNAKSTALIVMTVLAAFAGAFVLASRTRACGFRWR